MSTKSQNEVANVPSAPPPQNDPADERDPLLDRPEPSNRLDTFPPEATLTFAWDGGNAHHISDRIPSDGTMIVASFHCLVDGRAAMRELTKNIGAGKISVLVLAGRPATAGDDYRQYVAYARQVGGAAEVFTPSRELATLLGIDIPRDPRNRLRNGLLLVEDGAIVWRSVASREHPDAMPGYDPCAPKPFDLDGLREELRCRAERAS